MNIIQVMGNLGSDPETRYTPNGQKVTTFRIASNSKKAGKDITNWFRVTVWGDKFDKMISYLKKGSSVLVMGELHKPEIYNSRDNQPQVSLEITAEIIKFLPGRGTGERTEGGTTASTTEGGYGGGFGGGGFAGGGFGEGNQGKSSSFAEEEEIPF